MTVPARQCKTLRYGRYSENIKTSTTCCVWIIYCYHVSIPSDPSIILMLRYLVILVLSSQPIISRENVKSDLKTNENAQRETRAESKTCKETQTILVCKALLNRSKR